MVRWVRDTTGRCRERPHYDPEELDETCEAVVVEFLTQRYGKVAYPLTTDDLVRLVQRRTADLDLFADLSAEGAGVHGLTAFFADSMPKVRIAAELDDPRRRNRQRSTLTHELGHVEFHARIWTFHQAALPLFEAAAPPPLRCKRDAILGPDPVDWMEWQAGYASGAFLMPLTAVRRTVGMLLEERGLVGAVHVGAPAARDLIRRVQLGFEVSEDAARVRLFKLGHLTERIRPQPFRLTS
jgi:Zn-dependent peptidase ImmA (M78 family)